MTQRKIVCYNFRNNRRWKYLVSLSERVLGRVIAENIKNPVTGEIIIKKDKLIDEFDCEKIDAAGVKSVNVYSVITCASTKGYVRSVMEEI